MRKSIVVFMIMMVGLLQSVAQPAMKEKARSVINRTAHVILSAHKATIAHQQFTGNLQRAVVHQRLAINFYHDGKFGKAIAHSVRARELAIRHLLTLGENIPQGFEIAQDERVPMDNNANEEINAEAAQYIKSFSIPTDELLAKQPTIEGIELKEE